MVGSACGNRHGCLHHALAAQEVGDALPVYGILCFFGLENHITVKAAVVEFLVGLRIPVLLTDRIEIIGFGARGIPRKNLHRAAFGQRHGGVAHLGGNGIVEHGRGRRAGKGQRSVAQSHIGSHGRGDLRKRSQCTHIKRFGSLERRVGKARANVVFDLGISHERTKRGALAARIRRQSETRTAGDLRFTAPGSLIPTHSHRVVALPDAVDVGMHRVFKNIGAHARVKAVLTSGIPAGAGRHGRGQPFGHSRSVGDGVDAHIVDGFVKDHARARLRSLFDRHRRIGVVDVDRHRAAHGQGVVDVVAEFDETDARSPGPGADPLVADGFDLNVRSGDRQIDGFNFGSICRFKHVQTDTGGRRHLEMRGLLAFRGILRTGVGRRGRPLFAHLSRVVGRIGTVSPLRVVEVFARGAVLLEQLHGSGMNEPARRAARIDEFADAPIDFLAQRRAQ